MILLIPISFSFDSQVSKMTPESNSRTCITNIEGKKCSDSNFDLPEQVVEKVEVEAPTPTQHIEGVEQWRELVASYFPATSVNKALKVMRCESNGRPDAVNQNTNKSTDYGLFQINSVHSQRVDGDLESLFDPTTNVRVASEIYSEQGFNPWVCNLKVD